MTGVNIGYFFISDLVAVDTRCKNMNITIKGWYGRLVRYTTYSDILILMSVISESLPDVGSVIIKNGYDVRP